MLVDLERSGLFAVVFGADADEALEEAAEGEGVGDADLSGDLFDGGVGVGEESLGVFAAMLSEPMRRALAGGGGEALAEGGVADLELSGEGCEGDGGRVEGGEALPCGVDEGVGGTGLFGDEAGVFDFEKKAEGHEEGLVVVAGVCGAGEVNHLAPAGDEGRGRRRGVDFGVGEEEVVFEEVFDVWAAEDDEAFFPGGGGDGEGIFWAVVEGGAGVYGEDGTWVDGLDGAFVDLIGACAGEDPAQGEELEALVDPIAFLGKDAGAVGFKPGVEA